MGWQCLHQILKTLLQARQDQCDCRVVLWKATLEDRLSQGIDKDLPIGSQQAPADCGSQAGSACTREYGGKGRQRRPSPEVVFVAWRDYAHSWLRSVEGGA
jgi:hypothetical protein